MQMNSSKFRTITLFHNIAKILAPPPMLLVSDWADRYRKLSPEASAEPGQWHTDRAEFQREIMNSINDPLIQDIVIKSSAQVGKTEIVLNICGYFMDYEPASIMVIQPTIEMGETFSKDRLAPMIRDTDVLKAKVKEPRTKDSDNTILHKKFPGGHITVRVHNR
jgi:phage terminase large subunit GpA-like protein